MFVVHKYLINPVSVKFPKYAKVLDIQVQNSTIYCWALTEVNDPPVEGIINVYGTGWSIPTDIPHKHLKTIQLGELVWHIFDTRDFTV